jgi:hypothetical protein
VEAVLRVVPKENVMRPIRAVSGVALALALTAAPLFAQPSSDETSLARPVRLRSRTFTPKPGIDESLRRQVEQVRGKRLHSVIQFTDWPTLDERKSLERLGIQLLDPLPERAFFAVVTAEALRSVGQVRGFHWLGPVESDDKVAPGLLKDGAPAYARRGKQTAEYVVEFFGDVAPRLQQQILTRHRGTAQLRAVEINGWRVILAEARIPQLAREDAVKWIVEAPAPPEEDNDGARGSTALDADVVLAPAYSLSGSGVVIGQWEPTHASQTHGDFAGRITLGDPPLPQADVSAMHADSVAANTAFDNTEPIYLDMDDSGTASVGDVRATAAAGFAAGSVVAAGNADVGTALVAFGGAELWADTGAPVGVYNNGEPIYRDNDGTARVSIGDTRITPAGAFAAGSVVAAGEADINTFLYSLDIPNYHSTHVAGTALGSGAQSAAQGGGPNQWKGVAPGASLRSYDSPVINPEYANAATNSVVISTNSWGTSHCHQVGPTACYDVGSEYYDSVISGRQSSGLPSGLAGRIAIFGSSGNAGRPERHAENVAVNGLFDDGEAIYLDWNDSGTVSGADTRLSGPVQAAGTALVNFAANERHNEIGAGGQGSYQSAEGVYRDIDGSRTISVGDVRVTATGGFAAGSVVAAGNADVGGLLRQFLLWGNLRIPNSAKNTIEVASIASDTAVPAASTSRGPTADGRLKPDVSGPGWQAAGDLGITSTWPRNRYGTITGTSMSTPAVAGTAALVTEWHKTACDAAGPRPDVVKALLIHAAEDRTTIPNVAGAFAGPDFSHGYGRVRARNAVDLLPHHRLGSAAALGNIDTTVTVGAMAPLRVTLVWNDPPWTGNAAPSAATGLLQNDLDLILIAPDGTQYTPWQLNAANPFAPATATVTPAAMPIPAVAFDRLNTVEQVVVPNAIAGTWTIRVSASTLALPPQDFALVSEALPPQAGPCAAAPAADVWMKDNAADTTGAVPSVGTMWMSPALWNRQTADGGVIPDPPEFGQPNYMYASITNRSMSDTARATSIDVWLAPAAVGLSWPANFSYVGRFAVPNLSAGETRQVGPLVWLPPDPTPSDHFCLYARAMSSQDPITFVEGANIDTNARNSNNIVWRNINVVDLASSRSVTFLMRNLEKREATLDLVVRTDPELLRDGQVHVRPSASLQRAWPSQLRKLEGAVVRPSSLVPSRSTSGRKAAVVATPPVAAAAEEPVEQPSGEPVQIVAGEAVLRGFRFAGQEAQTVTLTFSSPRSDMAEFVVDVIQKEGDKEVGGIRYIVRTGHAKK